MCLTASQLISALAPNFAVLAGGRVLCAVTHGLMWSVIAPIGARLVPATHMARATTAIYVGTTLALVAGNPLTAAAWAQAMAVPPREGESVLVTWSSHPAVESRRPNEVTDLFRLEIMTGWIRTQRLSWSIVVLPEEHPLIPLMGVIDHTVAATTSMNSRQHWLFAHDWRSVPLEDWLRYVTNLAVFGCQAKAESTESGWTVMSRSDFERSVRSALTQLNQLAALNENPLIDSRMVGGDGVTALRDRLTEAIEVLATEPEFVKSYRAVVARYLEPTLTHEAAAERVGLPFSTYRRHLNRGVERICEELWRREV
jgi:hypothetical protein